MNVRERARAALIRNFSGSKDKKGYTQWPHDNLLPGIDLATVEGDLRRGDGDELRMKFRAVHSSSALAVNCFAPFKVHPSDLLLLGKQGATRVEFEWKLKIFNGGRSPNIDVWIDRDEDVVAVESKLLEYLTPMKPNFSSVYDRLAPPKSDACWWRVYEKAKEDTGQHLDQAQLVKHYFGLNEFRKKNPHGPKPTLLYIFWEPLNWQDVYECRQHREEIKSFADLVSDSQIHFRWMTYNDLWEEWSAVPNLTTHVRRLNTRYQVRI